ncbi:MAG: hypothetical protein M0R51_15870 [Clostridia bacterium]|jgi:hypothetical protein|nr:hypothetical protein [Clostridia bacterium]
MKLVNSAITERVTVKLNRSFTSDKVTGIMSYGVDNDYPQKIEKLILGSPTGKSVINIMSKFIAGNGFNNPEIGKIKVGTDKIGKDVTLDNIRIQAAESLAKYNGVHIHCNLNIGRQVVNTRIIPFKNCRLSKEDDNGYCAKIAVHQNWQRDSNHKKLENSTIAWFDHFNLNEAVFAEQIKGVGIENYKGQIYTLYLDDIYLYPLSALDTVYLDLDTEAQIALFKNNEVRDGFSDKIIMHVSPSTDDLERANLNKKIQAFMGADGDKALVFESLFDENGQLLKDGAFKFDYLRTNINDKLFVEWERSLSNNIRKAVFMPAVLIDYEQGQLSQASGEMLTQAVSYYNAITKTYREQLSEALKQIYVNHTNEVLQNNIDFSLTDLVLL